MIRAGIVKTRKVARLLTEIPLGAFGFLRLRRKWTCDRFKEGIW